eukprot:1190824-Prorocentrum_minimum.AAC.1
MDKRVGRSQHKRDCDPCGGWGRRSLSRHGGDGRGPPHLIRSKTNKSELCTRSSANCLRGAVSEAPNWLGAGCEDDSSVDPRP